jgi:trk system potassium uptake protein TrkH
LASTSPAPVPAPGPDDLLRPVEPPRPPALRRDPRRLAARAVLVNGALALVAAVLEFGFGGGDSGVLAVIGVIDGFLVLGVLAELVLRTVAARRPLAAFRERPLDVAALVLAVGLVAGGYPRAAGGAVMVRMAVLGLLQVREVPFAKGIFDSLRRRPLVSLCTWYAVAIFLGGVVLSFPAATAGGGGTSFVTALFTATSAVAVTGLAVVDTATHWSHFGHWVILVLVQLGGLGIMTLSSGLAMVFGGALSLRNRSALLDMHEEETYAGFRAMVVRVIGLTLAFEAVGASLLYLRFAADPAALGVPDGDPGSLVFLAVFHAVTAFCNAGFALWSDGLVRFVGDVPVNAILGILVLVGGLGFPVVGRLLSWQTLRSPRRYLAHLPVHDRLVLFGTGCVFVVGFLGFLVLEWSSSLAHLGFGDKLVAAGFASAAARTAGFNTVDYGAISPAGSFFTAVLMFVGGAPGGTAGGIKITTVAVMVLAVRTMLRNRQEVEVHGRRLPETTVHRAIAVTLMSALAVAVGFGLLLLLEPLPFDRLLFETVSAFGTTGLSMNTTPLLSTPGRLLLIVLMFVGRLGPFTLALAIGASRRPAAYSFPVGRVDVG